MHAPKTARVTQYDRKQMEAYIRLLDAEAANVEWADAAHEILGLDPTDQHARTCWQSHLNRARWMTEFGYRQLVQDRN